MPSVATMVTSARPIIRAAAVDAVRSGLRIAFSRARRPETPPIRANGRPSTEASGRASFDAVIADADEQPEHADGQRRSRGPVAIPWTNSP